MNRTRAFLFDLNGTMINDMPYHIQAWHKIMNEMGANISVKRMKEECYGKNDDVIERIFPGRFTQEEKENMSLEKEKKYQQEFRPHLRLIDGLYHFLTEARDAGIRLAIGSAAIMYNIDFVLDGLAIRKYFDAIVSADDVKKSKPDAETWVSCADKLQLSSSECIVFEDAPKGAESAFNAAMKCIIITNLHNRQEFEQYKNVIGFINDFTEISVSIALERASKTD